MFTRKDSGSVVRPGRATQGGLSFIGPEVVIGGDLTTTAQLHVDGRIDGHVRCHHLSQGETGAIAGDIVADEARIAGFVQGTVNAKTLIIEATARVAGDVTYETISIAAGAQIDGRLARCDAIALAADNAMLIATPAPTKRIRSASSTDMFPANQPAAV